MNKSSIPPIQINCGCVFDLDKTLTCGYERAKEAVDYCKANSCKIAINTARPTKWYHDIDLQKLGLSENDFVDDFYHYDSIDNFSYSTNSYIYDLIADKKVQHLKTFAQKWNIPIEKVILFDDQIHNITRAKDHGFSTVHANHLNCGIPNDVHKILDGIIKPP